MIFCRETPVRVPDGDASGGSDVLEGGGWGVLKGEGVGLGPPSSQDPPMVPAEGEPKYFEL